MTNFNETDAKIIKALQINAKQTNKELANLVGVAPSTLLERVRSLERREVIEGYHAAIDLQTIGRGTQALVSIRIQPPALKTFEAFREWLIQRSEVIDVFCRQRR